MDTSTNPLRGSGRVGVGMVPHRRFADAASLDPAHRTERGTDRDAAGVVARRRSAL